jgi:hypothetical protein
VKVCLIALSGLMLDELSSDEFQQEAPKINLERGGEVE